MALDDQTDRVKFVPQVLDQVVQGACGCGLAYSFLGPRDEEPRCLTMLAGCVPQEVEHTEPETLRPHAVEDKS